MLSREFFTAGEAIFTVEPSAEWLSAHPDAKPHYTFRIHHLEATDKYRARFLVSVLAGPDNDADYMPFANLLAFAGQLNPTRNCPFNPSSWVYRIAARLIAAVWADGDTRTIEAAGWRVRHNGTCARCGANLTNPKSLDTGIGPECSRRIEGGEVLEAAAGSHQHATA